MDYKKIKSYVDYQRYTNVDDDDSTKRKEAFLAIVQNEIRIIKEKLNSCKNPDGCSCEKSFNRDLLNLMKIEVRYKTFVRWDKEDVAEYRPTANEKL